MENQASIQQESPLTSQDDEHDLFQKLDESSSTNEKHVGAADEDNSSDAGSSGSSNHSTKSDIYPYPIKSSLGIYPFVFEEDSDSTKLIGFIAIVFIVSAVQFIPFYIGLHEELPYVKCANNFCIGNSVELVEAKAETMCRGAEPFLGMTHYFSIVHRFFLGFTAVMTNSFALFGVAAIAYRWKQLFGEMNYFKGVAYFAAQAIVASLNTAVIKVIDWANMVPDPEYSLIPVDVNGCINMSVIYSYYRPDDLHNQFWIIAAIYFPLFLIFMFRFLWDSIKLHDCREWTFTLLVTIFGSSTLAGWIFALIINYASGIQFSGFADSSEHFRVQQTVNIVISGLVFAISVLVFCFKRSFPPKN